MDIMKAAKEAFQIAQKLDNIELQRTILELQSQALELQTENAQLRSQLADLRADTEFESRLHFKNDCYWLDDGTGPFCSRCWDADRKKIRLHDYGHIWLCKACNSHAEKRDGRPRFEQPPPSPGLYSDNDL